MYLANVYLFLLPLQLPLNAQLEQALSHVKDNNRVIAEMKAAAQRAEQHANRLEKALTRAQSDLLDREKEISELRMKVGRLPSKEVSDHCFMFYKVAMDLSSSWIPRETTHDLKFKES